MYVCVYIYIYIYIYTNSLPFRKFRVFHGIVNADYYCLLRCDTMWPKNICRRFRVLCFCYHQTRSSNCNISLSNIHMGYFFSKITFQIHALDEYDKRTRKKVLQLFHWSWWCRQQADQNVAVLLPDYKALYLRSQKFWYLTFLYATYSCIKTLDCDWRLL
jgi:hypothetical protein